MANAEFQHYFGHFNPEEAREITDRWLNLPPYVHLPEGELQRTKSLVELQGNVEVFVEQQRQDMIPLVKGDQHFDALDLINQRLADAERMFSGDELLTARVFTLRGRAYIKEHLATFGGYSKLERDHPFRTVCFLTSAIDYMQADLELGCVTDYGLRISECFGGVGIGKLQMAALEKCFGGLENVTLIGRNDPNAMIMVSDLLRRATETIDLGQVPGGGSAVVIKGEYPDSQLN